MTTLPAAVLWDFDGTLIDSESMWEEVERGVARELGRDLPDDYHGQTVGGTVLATARLIAEVTGTTTPPERIADELWARSSADLSDGPIRWTPGASALVEALRVAGVPQALVSSGRRAYLDVILRRLDPVPFAVVVAGDEVTHNKPHPEGYLRAASALGVRPEDCLVLEDSRTGAAAGAAAGCVVLVVPSVLSIEDAPGRVLLATLEGLTPAGVADAFARGAATRASGRTPEVTDGVQGPEPGRPTAQARRPQPPQQPPPVQRLQLRYRKRGPARFTSHRDVARALERGLRRAGVPMAYSSGFTPHPRISYAGASATGAATEADYLELGLAERCDPLWLRDALSAALPEGIDIVDAVEPVPGGRGLVERLTASRWRIELGGVDEGRLAAGASALLDARTLQVERLTKNGLRHFDARPALMTAEARGAGVLELVLVQGVPLVRPDDIVSALAGLGVVGTAALFTRLDQGEWIDGRLVDPFAEGTTS